MSKSVPGVLRAAPAAMLLLGIWLTGAPTSAGVVTIQYNINGGTLDWANGGTPYFGGGTYTVRHTAASTNSLLSGPATLVTLNVTAGSARPGLLGAPGTYPTTFSSFSLATFRTGGSVVTGSVNILSTLTLYIPTLMTFVPVPTGSGSGGNAQWSASGSIGRLQVASTVISSAAPFVVPFAGTFTGVEASRTFVPEPGTSPLLAASFLSLLAIAWIRGRSTQPSPVRPETRRR